KGGGPFHTPVKSGFLSGPRGAGAVRFGLPSAVRGMPGQRRSNHWAPAGIVAAIRMTAATNSLIHPSDFNVEWHGLLSVASQNNVTGPKMHLEPDSRYQ